LPSSYLYNSICLTNITGDEIMLHIISQLTKSVTALSLIIIVSSASPSYAKAPSNEDLHLMILGMKYKLDKLEVENKGLKKQLNVALNKFEGRAYASLSPASHGGGAKPQHPAPTPIKAVVRNERQTPQVAANGKTRETSVAAKPDKKPSKYYAALNLEYAVPENVSVETGGATGDASLADGIGFGISVGHKYNDKFRSDIELSRRSFELQNITPTSGGSARSLSGQVDIYSALVNGYYNLPDSAKFVFLNSPFRPYIGAGIGVTYLRANDVSASLQQTAESGGKPQNNTTPENASIWLPAGQLTAGLSFPMTNTLDFDLGYRYFLMGDITGTVNGSSGDSSVLRSHSLKLGARYNFN
jgi:opacity protein-like surface antigen